MKQLTKVIMNVANETAMYRAMDILGDNGIHAYGVLGDRMEVLTHSFSVKEARRLVRQVPELKVLAVKK